MTKPPQITCTCSLWPFPHRRAWECANLESEQEIAGDCLTSYERGVDERNDDRQRAKDLNREQGRRR